MLCGIITVISLIVGLLNIGVMLYLYFIAAKDLRQKISGICSYIEAREPGKNGVIFNGIAKGGYIQTIQTLSVKEKAHVTDKYDAILVKGTKEKNELEGH